jgi:hypothetical protein
VLYPGPYLNIPRQFTLSRDIDNLNACFETFDLRTGSSANWTPWIEIKEDDEFIARTFEQFINVVRVSQGNKCRAQFSSPTLAATSGPGVIKWS